MSPRDVAASAQENVTKGAVVNRLESVLAANRHAPFSVLFHGRKGVGKRTTAFSVMKACTDPSTRSRILAGTPDILELRGDEGVATCRELLPKFASGYPKELDSKWLVVNNTECASREVHNLFLKLVEEPRNFHVIFCANSTQTLPSPLLSRLHGFKFPALSRDQLRDYVTRDPSRKVLEPYLDRYEFRSMLELECFFKFDVESFLKSIWKDSITEVTSRIDSFLKQLRELPEWDKQGFIPFFLNYITTRLETELKIKNKEACLDALRLKFAPSLLRDRIPSNISRENQLKAFLFVVYALKRYDS